MSDTNTTSNGDLFDIPVTTPKKRVARPRKSSDPVPQSNATTITAETKTPRRSKAKAEASQAIAELPPQSTSPSPRKRGKATAETAVTAPELKPTSAKKRSRASEQLNATDAALSATAPEAAPAPVNRVRRALQAIVKGNGDSEQPAKNHSTASSPAVAESTVPVVMEPRGVESPRSTENEETRPSRKEQALAPTRVANDDRRQPERQGQQQRHGVKNDRHPRPQHPQRHDPRKGNGNGNGRFERPALKHANHKARKPDAERANAVLEGPKIEVEGLLEITPKGSGFLRKPGKQFEQGKDDVFVPAGLLQRFGVRAGVWLKGFSQMGSRGEQMVEILGVNGLTLDEARKLPHFDELRAINPSKRIPFETESTRFTTRVLDLVAPVGRGQRGLIVSPPRSGKTTLLLHIAESIRQREDDSLHLMVLLVDERPEEVTEFRRALPGVELFASSNDENARNHCRIAELAIERAKRLVEAGKHVFLLMDSITRLARAYNQTMSSGPAQHRGVGSGGIMVGALEAPRRLFAAARNTSDAGSLTILATALIQTNSRADDAIFQEFKGTGNMEIVLDRKIAEQYIYPAVDIFKSGTRREELLLPEHMLHKINMIRRGLSGHKPLEAMERLTFFLKKFASNAQMLLEIKG